MRRKTANAVRSTTKRLTRAGLTAIGFLQRAIIGTLYDSQRRSLTERQCVEIP